MEKQIVLIHKAAFHKRPPVISVLLILKSLGYNVTLLTTDISDEWRHYLQENQISFLVINTFKSNNFFSKIYDYLKFRFNVYKYLDTHINIEESLIWIEGAYTIRALGNKINDYKHILQIQELHENSNPQLKAISKVINTASAVFMPEYNRAIMYKIWFNLNNMPHVLPNKPYFIPSATDLDKLESKYEHIVRKFKNKKVILYQGHIGADRDLSKYVKAVKDLGNEYLFVLIGTDYGMVDNYKKINPSIIHIEYISAPDYLVFTRLSYIGIVSYNCDSLNNAYCAPNKIWEYAYFGLPMIGNDIPGLRYTIFYSGAGECIDVTSSESIKQAILKIDSNYLEYNKKSKKFYETSDNKQIIRNILETL